MPQPTPPFSDPPAALDARVDAAEARLAALEASLLRFEEALGQLRAAIAGEVRTRRLVLVDGGGFERLVAEAAGSHGSLILRGRGADGSTTAVQLFANDPTDGEGNHVGIALGERGEIVATLEVTDEREPVLWLRSPDDG